MAELHLSESSGFSFGFEKSEDVSLSDGSFDVSDDGSLGVIEELDLDLGTLTLGTSSAENVGDLGKFDWGGGLIHVG